MPDSFFGKQKQTKENFMIFQFSKENEKILLKYGEQRKKRKTQPSIEKKENG